LDDSLNRQADLIEANIGQYSDANEILRRANEDKDYHLNKRYGFQLCNINFLIEENVLSEITNNYEIYPFPNVPKWVLGLITLHGNLVPVFDLRSHLQSTQQAIMRTHLLVIDEGEKAVGIYIDTLPRVLQLDPEDTLVAQVPDSIPAILIDHVRMAYDIENETWLEINYDSFFSSLTQSLSSD